VVPTHLLVASAAQAIWPDAHTEQTVVPVHLLVVSATQAIWVAGQAA